MIWFAVDKATLFALRVFKAKIVFTVFAVKVVFWPTPETYSNHFPLTSAEMSGNV